MSNVPWWKVAIEIATDVGWICFFALVFLWLLFVAGGFR